MTPDVNEPGIKHDWRRRRQHFGGRATNLLMQHGRHLSTTRLRAPRSFSATRLYSRDSFSQVAVFVHAEFSDTVIDREQPEASIRTRIRPRVFGLLARC